MLKFDKTGEQEINLSEMTKHVEMDNQCPSINGIFRPGPAFSLFAVLDVALLRLRLSRYRRDCGLGRGRNLPFLGEY